MKSFRLAILPAVALLLGACDAVPTAPDTALFEPVGVQADAAAERYVFETVYDLTGEEFTLFCEDGGTSETVVLSGELLEVYTFIALPDGSMRNRYSSTALNVAATGSLTGDAYRVSVQLQGSTHLGDGLMFSYRDRFRLRNIETGDAFDVIVTGRARLDGTGEIIIDQQHVRISCPEV